MFGAMVLIGMLCGEQLDAGQAPTPANNRERATDQQRAKVGRVGVEFQALTPELARAFELDPEQASTGALVLWVQADGPAAAAGLASGDIVLTADGVAVGPLTHLRQLLENLTEEHTVMLEVWRFGERDDLEFTLPALSESHSTVHIDTTASYENNPLRLGVADLAPDLHEEFGMRGVIVEGVAPGPARRAGIKPGDSLLMIRRLNVANAAQFQGLVKSLPKDKPLPVLIERGGRLRFVVVTLTE